MTIPDRDYDICIDGKCQSPGCGNDECNVPGPHFPLADTSQRDCYDLSSIVGCAGAGGTPTCEATDGCGEDAQYGWDVGHLQSQRFYRTLPATAQPIVEDLVTGLVWQGCAAGKSTMSCTGTSTLMNWGDALSYCNALQWGGHDDWRLPDDYEMQSLAHYGVVGHGIETSSFPGTSQTIPHWTSSTAVGGNTDAWAGMFKDGSMFPQGDKTLTRIVRCVRGTPTPKSSRYALTLPVNDQPIISDNYTGRVWQGCVAGLTGAKCENGSAVTMTWYAAMKHCEGSTWGGIDTWRLPSITELYSVSRHKKYWPSFDTTLFSAMPSDSYLRSSTTVADAPDRAWFLGTRLGATYAGATSGYSKTDSWHVLCVSN